MNNKKIDYPNKERKRRIEELKKEAESLNLIIQQEKKSVRRQFLIRPGINEKMLEESKRQGISVNEFVNNLLESYFEKQEK